MLNERLQRKIINDKYNKNKTWEITKLSSGIYLRQYIKGRQFGRGIKTNRKNILNIFNTFDNVNEIKSFLI